jgi:hypothetical protein
MYMLQVEKIIHDMVVKLYVNTMLFLICCGVGTAHMHEELKD